MKVIMVPVITGALGTVFKSLVKELEEVEIVGQRPDEICCHSDSSEISSANARGKKSQEVL